MERGKTMKTAAIYARFSSDLQKDRSIDDQVLLCKKLAERNGYKVTKVYSDRAKSGASMFERDGLLSLLKDAERTRPFDAVIVEALSRLSRDQEDTAGIYKRLKFRDITIMDQGGEVGDVHIGVGGIVNSMFLKNLADAVRRRHIGSVHDGKIPGKCSYGHRVVPGKPGEREIDPERAEVVKRIFDEYATGKCGLEIVQGLRRDGILSGAKDGVWDHKKLSSIMLANRIYIGEFVYNRAHAVKNPATGKNTRRANNPEDVISIQLPHLRIVDQATWDKVQTLRHNRKIKMWGSVNRPANKTVQKNFLAGLFYCATCNGTMRVTRSSGASCDGTRIGCVNAAFKGKCDHKKSYILERLEQEVLKGLKNELNAEAVSQYTEGAMEELQRRQKDVGKERGNVQKAISNVTVKIDRFVTALGESDDPPKPIMDKIKALETERAHLEEKLRLVEAEVSPVAFHPNTIKKFVGDMHTIHEALTSENLTDELTEPFKLALRNVFERIAVLPTGWGKTPMIQPYFRLAAILGIEIAPVTRTTEEILATQGLSENTLSGNEPSYVAPQCTIVSFGIWGNKPANHDRKPSIRRIA